MKIWQDELLELMISPSPDEQSLKRCLEKAAFALGFRYYSFAYQKTLPMNRPKFSWLSNYPDSWTEQYLTSGFLSLDPRVKRARVSQDPFVWDEKLFEDAATLWNALKQRGLHQGLTLSVLGRVGGISMTSFVCPETASLRHTDVMQKLHDFQLLAQLTHACFSKLVSLKAATEIPGLTDREVEVMKWSADGKSAQDIADILDISKNTVNFHIKNTVHKLGVPNKTVAVVRAVTLGLLKDGRH